jgi:hypothetical protein
LFGLWRGDRKFGEWAFQMWAAEFQLSTNCKPSSQVPYTVLHLAAIHNYKWVVDLLLCEGGTRTENFIDMRSLVDGNTALHYSVMRGNVRLCASLTTSMCNLQVKNYETRTAAEIVIDAEDRQNRALVVKIEDARAFVQRVVGVSQLGTKKDLERLAKEVPSDFNATEISKEGKLKKLKEVVKEQEKVVISLPKGNNKHKGGGDTQINPDALKKCTEEDVRRANQMEQELLRLLEEEESAQKDGKKKGNTTTKAAGSKKKK